MTDGSGSSTDGEQPVAGDVEEMFSLAREALGRRDPDSAAGWLERAAATGSAEAMHRRANLAYRLRDDEAAANI